MMDGQTERQIKCWNMFKETWMDGTMDVCMDERLGGQTDGWIKGQNDR